MKKIHSAAIDLDAVHGGMRWYPWDRESTNVEDRRPQSQGGPVPDHDWQREQQQLDPHYTPPRDQQPAPQEPRDDDRSGRGAPMGFMGNYGESSNSEDGYGSGSSGGDANGSPYADTNESSYSGMNESYASPDYGSEQYSDNRETYEPSGASEEEAGV